jgi:hypothetical protein
MYSKGREQPRDAFALAAGQPVSAQAGPNVKLGRREASAQRITTTRT